MNGNDIKHDDHDAMHSCFICQAPATKKCPFCEADVYYCCQSHFELHRSKSNNGEAQCNPFSIKFTESVGRYMVANRDIEAGETIFQDTAAVVGPAVDTLPLCLNCHAKIMEDDYVRCPICQFPMCDEHCVSGLEHKKVCEYLRNKGSVVVDMDKSNQIYDVVLPLKILALKKSAPERYALVTQFMDHKSERFKFEDYWIQIKETVVDVILDLPGIPEDTTEEDILRIIGLLDTNSHEIHNRNGISYKGMFPIGALLSHRCIVNSRQIMTKYTPFLNSCRSTVFIPKGAEIFTTYIWPHLSTCRRRQTLREGWHFSCTCLRCSDPAEMGALTSAVLCQGCDGGYLLHENPLESPTNLDLDVVEDEHWKCHKCEIKGDSNDINEIVKGLNDELNDLMRNDLEGNMDLLTKCRESLHVNHYILTELRARIIPIICRQPPKQIFHFPQDVIELKRSLCKENLAVLNIITPGRSVQRGGLLFELQECEFFIAKFKLENEMITEDDFVGKLSQCKNFLLECGQCLHKERPNSMEHFYEQSAMASLKQYNQMLT